MLCRKEFYNLTHVKRVKRYRKSRLRIDNRITVRVTFVSHFVTDHLGQESLLYRDRNSPSLSLRRTFLPGKMIPLHCTVPLIPVPEVTPSLFD